MSQESQYTLLTQDHTGATSHVWRLLFLGNSSRYPAKASRTRGLIPLDRATPNLSDFSTSPSLLLLHDQQSPASVIRQHWEQYDLAIFQGARAY